MIKYPWITLGVINGKFYKQTGPIDDHGLYYFEWNSNKSCPDAVMPDTAPSFIAKVHSNNVH